MDKSISFKSIHELLIADRDIPDIVRLIEKAVWWQDDFGITRKATKKQKKSIYKELTRLQSYKSGMPEEQELFFKELELWGEPGTEDRVLVRAGWPLEKLSIDNMTLLSENSGYIHDNAKTSLHKMILGMAIIKYGYETGGKNKCTGEGAGSIQADLAKAGINLSNDTIKKHLEEAANNDLIKPSF